MSKKNIIYETREEWMMAALEPMTELFASKGYEVPQVRVSCGWPSRGGLANGKRMIGQYWGPETATDKVAQIFISPYLEDKTNQGVLPTLVHEVVHAVVGAEAKHGKKFKDCAVAVGLDGKMTATHAGDELMEMLKSWQADLGQYPHSKLDYTKAPGKKQTTRMIKMECAECGYIARTSQKWLDTVGPVDCPAGHGPTNVE